MAHWGHLHTWFSRMLFLMSDVFGNSGAYSPDSRPEMAGGKGFKVCLFYFFCPDNKPANTPRLFIFG